MKIVLLPDCNSIRYLQGLRHYNDEGAFVVPLFESDGISELRKLITASESLKLMTLSDLGVAVSQKDISRTACHIVKSIAPNNDFVSGFLDTYSNMYSLHIHSWVEKITLLDLVFKKLPECQYIILGKRSSRFYFPERIDVKALYDSTAVFSFLADVYLKQNCANYSFSENCLINFTNKKHAIRSMLLNLYKFKVIFSRRINLIFRGKYELPVNSDLAVIIRAQSEYFSVRPLLNLFKEQGVNFVILQDDLIKNPSGKQILEKSDEQYIPIHHFISIRKLFLSWFQGSFYFFRARKLSANFNVSSRSYSAVEKVFIDTEVARGWISSSMHSAPELAVFTNELDNVQNQICFKKVISLDMVDQWAAALCKFSKQRKVITHIIQNTVLDDIYYPRSVLSEHIYVSGSKMNEILGASNSGKGNIYALGLPVHDSIYNNFVKHRGFVGDKLRILVATQPFVQTYPYNDNLLIDLLSVLGKIGVASEVIIKPHPRENIAEYKRKIKQLKVPEDVDISLSFESDILSMSQNIDIFVSRTSTAIQSLSLLGRMCISYLNEYPKEICNRLDYLKSDMVIKAENIFELETILSDIIHSFPVAQKRFEDAREDYICKYIGLFDGRSSQRLLNMIENSEHE